MSAVSPLLSGTHGPIADESVFDDLPVIGEVPQDLNGAFFRNGPERALPAARPLPLVRRRRHAARRLLRPRPRHLPQPLRAHAAASARRRPRAARSGRESWTRRARDRPDMPLKDTSNTDVKFHAGRLVTMWYLAGQPYHVDPWTLETIGPADFKGTLHTHVSAHSKVDEQTDEFVYFDYTKTWPYMSYGIAGPDGAVRKTVNVELPGPSLPHDMAFTKKHVDPARPVADLRPAGLRRRPPQAALLRRPPGALRGDPARRHRARRALVRGRALLHLPRRQRLGRRRRGGDGRPAATARRATCPGRRTSCATPRRSHTCRSTPACTSGASTCAPARRASG